MITQLLYLVVEVVIRLVQPILLGKVDISVIIIVFVRLHISFRNANRIMSPQQIIQRPATQHHLGIIFYLFTIVVQTAGN